MKLQMFCATAIAFAVWGCEGLLDEQSADTLTSGGDASGQAIYRVGVNMADNSDILKNVNLNVYRDGDGNPTCIGVHGFGTQVYYVKLEHRGNGEWRINPSSNNADGNYDRYQRADNTVPLDITLHWTIARSEMKQDKMNAAMTEAKNSRLEYLSSKWGDTSYEYQNDADGKSGITKGELLPNDALIQASTFNVTCDS